MQIAILVQSPPQAPGCRLALDFAESAVGCGHSLPAVFFFKGGVTVANRFAQFPSDELNPRDLWQDFAKNSGTSLLVCISAAHRRGINPETISESFEIVGLGQFATMTIESGRLVCF